MHNPEEKQLVFENTYGAIIDADTWVRVQELRKNKDRQDKYVLRHYVLCRLQSKIIADS